MLTDNLVGFNEVVNLLLTMASMQSVVKEELIQILLRVCEQVAFAHSCHFILTRSSLKILSSLQDASAWNTFVEMASIKGLLLLAASPNTVAQRKTALELRNMASQVTLQYDPLFSLIFAFQGIESSNQRKTGRGWSWCGLSGTPLFMLRCRSKRSCM